MSFIKKAWAWIIWSSVNPSKVSLTLRGILAGAATLLTVYANLQHLTLPSEVLTQWGDATIAFVQSFLVLVATGMTLYGAARKLWTTLNGSNAVVAEHPAFVGPSMTQPVE